MSKKRKWEHYETMRKVLKRKKRSEIERLVIAFSMIIDAMVKENQLLMVPCTLKQFADPEDMNDIIHEMNQFGMDLIAANIVDPEMN